MLLFLARSFDEHALRVLIVNYFELRLMRIKLTSLFISMFYPELIQESIGTLDTIRPVSHFSCQSPH